MATGFISLLFSLLSLLFFGFSSFAKPIPSFPSSIIQAEKISPSSPNELYHEKFFTQVLDHYTFRPQSYKTFQQRYLINDRYWGGAEKNAPIFLYTGNEGDIEWFAQNTGFMFDIAPYFKPLLVFIEHRFYGKSMPFGGNKEVAYSNSSTLGYLTSTQALADYATLIIDLKKNLSATDSPVVVFGGSYGGMLAAWFRLKYPHVAIGALASSSPILNFENITSPYSFNNIITQDFRVPPLSFNLNYSLNLNPLLVFLPQLEIMIRFVISGCTWKLTQGESENCYKVIKGSWQEIEDTASQPGGLEILRRSFRICRNFISASSLQSWLYTALVYTAMTDYPTPSNFLSPMPAYPVKEMCKAIDDPKTGNNTFAKLYGAASVYYNYSGNATCFDLDDDSDPHGLGGWSWQACTEMILPTSGSNKDSIFPASEWNYEDRAAFCKAYFGVEPRPNWITTEFGGHDIKRVLKRFGSNIIFFNGLRDPWSGAHHVDLRFATSEDPKWLQDVRKREVSIIAKWLSEYYDDLDPAN
ncbi:hypothetical protein NC651_016770 [Populus alba x Populus x berolinensis]|nr:hypothetical protein NC651_016770 [Populus alba x Populus x berolinensis]